MLRLIALALMLPASVAFAEATLPAGSEVQVFIENDMLARTDRYYTNGMKIGLGAPLAALQLPAKSLLDWIAPEKDHINLGLFVGQNMYTPRKITVAAPQPDDRPWAAWLYLGGVAQRALGNRLDTAEVDVGVVGPAALGRQVQSDWHRLIGSPQPQGWANQIPNEVGFLVSYLQKRRYGSDVMDIVPHAGVTFGTVMTLARAGAMVRVGRNLSGFGPDTVEPGGAMLQNTRRASAGSVAGSEWYGFAGFDQRLVVRNIFLDGAMFHDGPSVGRRPHVYDLTAGFVLRIERWRLSLTRVWRSEEFFTPTRNGGRQTFDSLNLGIDF